MKNAEKMIEMYGIEKRYEIKSLQEEDAQEVEVLKGIDISVEFGEYVSIMGKSGGGKTTLLKIMGLMSLPTKGTVLFKGRDVNELWKDELADIRRREIGFVFQDFSLLDSLSALDNIMLPGIVDKMEESLAKERAYKLGEQFELSRKLLSKAPYELSGGEKQRVAICRALMNDPDLILADEPTGSLDEESGKLVADILKDIHVKMNKTIVLVTHNPVLASTSEKVCILKGGRIENTIEFAGNQKQYYQEILRYL